MAQPYDRRAIVAPAGDLDSEYGAYWIGNPWLIASSERNLSSFERNRCYLNTGGTFVDISFISGADSDADARGVAVGDYNNDGKMDLFVRNSGGGSIQLFENRFPSGHWLKASLQGRESNRLGVGARLVARLDNGTELTRELFPADTFKSQSPHYVHFGLGQHERVDALTIHWPSGHTDRHEQIPGDQHLRFIEGSSEYSTVLSRK